MSGQGTHTNSPSHLSCLNKATTFGCSFRRGGEAQEEASRGQTKPGTLHYKGARIYTSDLKQGYRVMMPGEKRVDVLFRWASYPSKEACLAAIKRVVDGK